MWVLLKSEFWIVLAALRRPPPPASVTRGLKMYLSSIKPCIGLIYVQYVDSFELPPGGFLSWLQLQGVRDVSGFI